MKRVAALLLAFASACDERIVDVVVPVDAAAPTFPRSCLEIYAPGAPDGLYWLDADGAGGAPAAQSFCDMSNGGWTRIVSESFDAPSPVFNLNQPHLPPTPPPTGVAITTCGAFGSILGGHRVLGLRDEVTLPLTLPPVPHTQVRIAYDLIVLDSWDGERAYFKVDGQEVWTNTCGWGGTECNQVRDECGWTGEGQVDGVVPVDVTVPHSASAIVLGFGAVLDQGRADESWAIDNLSVLVR